MVNLNKRCNHDGCSEFASFGVQGTTTREFCGSHKGVGMVNIRRKRCVHSGCITTAVFGVEGTRITEFCARHKRKGMVDVKSQT